jgi:hypothetical protein
MTSTVPVPTRRRPAARIATFGVGIAALAGAAITVSPLAASAGVSPRVSATGPYAWALADQPSNPGPYSPAAATQYNSTTTTSATVTRSATGKYNVFFPGMATTDTGEGAKGTAFVSDPNCKLTGWSKSGTGVNVGVACFRQVGVLNQGLPIDASFQVSFTNREAALGFPVRFALADQLTGSYTPALATRFNYTQKLRVANPAVGSYTVTFGSANAGDIPKLTAYGADNVRCNIKSWLQSGTDVKVKVGCFDGTGAAANSRFVMQLGHRNALYGDGALHDVGVSSVAPGVDWTYRNGVGFLSNSNIQITSSFPGWYHLKLVGQDGNSHYIWNITTVGGAGKSCFASEESVTAGAVGFSIACYKGTQLKATDWTFEFNAVS